MCNRRVRERAVPQATAPRSSDGKESLPDSRSAEIENAAEAGDGQARAGCNHERRKANLRPQRGSLPGAFRSSCIAVNDDLLVEGAVGVQDVGQAGTSDQDAEDDEASRAHQA